MQMVIIPILFIILMGYSVGKAKFTGEESEKFKSGFNAVIIVGIILYIVGGFLW